MDKQIEEIARVLNECCNYYDEHGNHIGNKCSQCEEWCDTNHVCCSYNTKEATALYNAGYRKASDVAREIDDLKRYIRLNEDIALKCKEENGEQNREYWKGKLSAFKQIRGYIDAELKKKYTEDGE